MRLQLQADYEFSLKITNFFRRFVGYITGRLCIFYGLVFVNVFLVFQRVYYKRIFWVHHIFKKIRLFSLF